MDCHPICSKALRFAKIVQDNKSNLKNKGAIMKDSGVVKKRNTKEVKRDLHLSSASIDDYQINLKLIGASLGITLDGKPARFKNDVIGDFLHEIDRTGVLPPS
uniref:Uncharacterized protein n=1 Tax=Tanacetum cinerariifolium TaxID=118510 RepID=A0A6L2KG72_TANCI|nr:hypothetical protein [Tanacetum cinerariifolium]